MGAPPLGMAAGGVGVGTVALGTTLALGTAIGSLSYLSGQTWNPFYQNEKTEIKKLPSASGAMAQSLKGPATSITKLIVSILFCSIFLGSYFIADAVQYRLNPDLELEELHFYLTADPSETRLPRLPEIFSTISALIATPLLAEKFIF